MIVMITANRLSGIEFALYIFCNEVAWNQNSD